MAHEGHDHGEHGHTHEHEHEHEQDHARTRPSASDEGEPLLSPSESTARFGEPVVEAITPLTFAGFGAARTVLHVDPIGGAAGDMLVGALIDLGADRAAIARAVDALGLGGVRVRVQRRPKHAIEALGIVVLEDAPQPPRSYATIRKLLLDAGLDDRVRALASLAFLRLGEAEARVHRTTLADVHFHEVGSVDALVDIVGACAALASIEAAAGGVGALAMSFGPLPVGGGRTRGAHGSIPIPAPATLELLTGFPIRDAGFAEGQERELVTPTGAALLRAFAEALPSSAGRWPAMVPTRSGFGAGMRDLADRPNVVRLTLGQRAESPTPREATASAAATHVVLEANLDDASAEVIGATIEALLLAGALDAWAQPLTMKKSRPATLLGAIAERARLDALADAMLAHSGSLGVRVTEVVRKERPRRFARVGTRYGEIAIKIADGDGLPTVVHPELEDCRRAATEHAVPVRTVIAEALRVFGSARD
jgi:uncharacterized protein (TIGR00299 family) protein